MAARWRFQRKNTFRHDEMLKWCQDINYVKIEHLNCCRFIKWNNGCNNNQMS